MFGMILSWLSGDVLGKLVGAYTKHLDANTEQDKVKADVLKKQIDAELESQKLSQQVRLATAGFWEMRLMTALIAAPFVLHAALVGLDTSFKLGMKIPAYPAPFDQWEGSLLLSFFGVQVASKAISTVASAFLARR